MLGLNSVAEVEWSYKFKKKKKECCVQYRNKTQIWI